MWLINYKRHIHHKPKATNGGIGFFGLCLMSPKWTCTLCICRSVGKGPTWSCIFWIIWSFKVALCKALLHRWPQCNHIKNEALTHWPSIHMPSHTSVKMTCIVCEVHTLHTYYYQCGFKFMCWKEGCYQCGSWGSCMTSLGNLFCFFTMGSFSFFSRFFVSFILPYVFVIYFFLIF
jgi:hypothetical protein